CTLGHRHPKVTNAVKQQIDRYAHVMDYGEYAQKPAVDFCRLLAENLPESLNQTYLVNSGTEAIEGAMKLAKRATGRTQIIAANKAYHGNTQVGRASCRERMESAARGACRAETDQ